MFAVMKELVKHKYSRLIYPNIPAASTTIANARTSGLHIREAAATPAYAFNVGYTRAMMQAALGAAARTVARFPMPRSVA